MDPKHQFAAQYVLSRAAAERREREILASSSLGIKSERRYSHICVYLYTFLPVYVNRELIERRGRREKRDEIFATAPGRSDARADTLYRLYPVT